MDKSNIHFKPINSKALNNWTNILKISLLLIFFVSISCLKEEPSPISVVTEDILLTTGERVVVSARLLATAEVTVTQHGFQISEDENFNSVIQIDLGEKTIPGRFVGQYNSLVINTSYFVRSFIDIGTEVIYGNVLPFNTLEPVIDSFTPKVGVPGNLIIIQGRNITNDAKVFFNGRETQVISIENESFITARIPAFNGEVFQTIRVEIKDRTFEAEVPFEYVTGLWEKVDFFYRTNENFVANISFISGDEMVFGLGAINGFGPYVNKVYKYHIPSGEWNTVSYPGPAAGFGFSCDGIIGNGSTAFVRTADQSYNLNNDYYTYENGALVFKGNTPFALLKGSAERIGDNAYIFGGLNSIVEYSKWIYRYNFSSDTWSVVGELPLGINTSSDFPTFVFQDEIYYVTDNAVIYKYNPLSNSSTWVTDYPGVVTKGGFAQIVGAKLYIGNFDGLRNVHEYDLETGEWKLKMSFAGSVRDGVVAEWSRDGAAYIFSNSDEANSTMNVWKFTPENF